MEEGGQRSTYSVTFIVPFELDCEEAEAVPAVEERNQNAEREVIGDLTQLSIVRDEENGVENKATDQQLISKLSTRPTNEGDYLQCSDTLPESLHHTSPESTIIEEA